MKLGSRALDIHVSLLRKAFEDGSDGETYVVTVPSQGYRLVGLRPEGETAPPGKAERPTVPETSIAVLPFVNMSRDQEQEYFADGLVEDLIAGLSRMKWLLVIARNSSFTYKNRTVGLQQIGQELGSRYVLEGSVRKAGQRVRVSVQLIEAQTGLHLWAERYDREFNDLFELQDEITCR